MGVLSGTLRPMAFKNVKKPLFSAFSCVFYGTAVNSIVYSNFHQSKFSSGPPPPLNFRYRSWTPFAPLTRHDCVSHLSKAPVGLTLRVAINGPVSLSSRDRES